MICWPCRPGLLRRVRRRSRCIRRGVRGAIAPGYLPLDAEQSAVRGTGVAMLAVTRWPCRHGSLRRVQCKPLGNRCVHGAICRCSPLDARRNPPPVRSTTPARMDTCPDPAALIAPLPRAATRPRGARGLPGLMALPVWRAVERSAAARLALQAAASRPSAHPDFRPDPDRGSQPAPPGTWRSAGAPDGQAMPGDRNVGRSRVGGVVGFGGSAGGSYSPWGLAGARGFAFASRSPPPLYSQRMTRPGKFPVHSA